MKEQSTPANRARSFLIFGLIMGLSLIGVGVYTNNSGLILGGFGFIAMGFFMARFGARSQKQREELKSLAKDIGLNYSTKWWPKPGIRPGRISPILKE